MSKRYKSTAFFIELMVNILVFSVSCAILVGLFGEAASYSRKSARQASAAGEVQNLVETVKAQGLEGLGKSPTGDTATLYYTPDWQRTDDLEAAVYQVLVAARREATEAGTLTHIEASAWPYLMYTNSEPWMYEGTEPIYELSTAVYLPDEGGAAA